LRLSGRTAVITGAGTGLGRAIAHRFASEGARVMVVDVAGAPDVVEQIVAKGHEAVASTIDITSEKSVEAMVHDAVTRFGRIDILVNNAAIASEIAPAPFEKRSVAEWRRILEVNVIGVFILCRAVAPIMRAQKYGRIINLSSGTTLRGAPQVLHYVASKGAVGAMTLALASELGADGITVNAIAPGYILTEGNLANSAMNESLRDAVIRRRAIPREAVPDDIVGTAVYLASDDAAFVSSQIIVVNGGLP
jgi:NAD(P)-dependent dehydrogenase (short-subunit alcohol dehydrogenase family)